MRFDRNVAIGIGFVLLFVSSLYSQSADTVSQANHSRPIPGNRQKNFAKIGDRLANEPSSMHTLDYYFAPQNLGFQYRRLKADKRLHILLTSELVCKELELDANTRKLLQDASKKLEEQWAKCKTKYSTSGDVSRIDEHEERLIVFHQKLKSYLDPLQLNRLDLAALRLKSDGSKKYHLAMSLGRHLAADMTKIQHALRAAKDESVKAKRAGNILLIGEVNSLFPDFLAPIETDELDRLPVLPLAHLLAQIKSPQISKRYFEEAVTNSDIKLSEGKWLFSSPVYFNSPDNSCQIRTPPLTPKRPVAPWFLLRTQVNLELVGEQARGYESLVRRKLKKLNFGTSDQLSGAAHYASSTAGDDAEIETESDIVNWMASELLPPQKRAIANYCRLHSLFMFGPDLVREHLEKNKQLKMSSSSYRKKLVLMTKRLEQHVQQSQKQVMRKFWDECSDQFEPEYEKSVFLCEGSNAYECWLNGFLKSGEK